MMNKPIRILGIAGSLRRESYNRAALRTATTLVPEGAILETFALDGIPVFNQDEEQNPPAKVAELKRRIRKEGNLTDETTQDFICQLLQNLVEWTRRIGQL
jgi:chromate reductase